MPARRQRRLGFRVVQVIRRGDMDDVDPRVSEHGLEALVGRWQAERSGAFRGPGVAGPNDSMHLHAQPAQGFDMHEAYEARADDGRADFGDRPAWLHSADSTRFDHNRLTGLSVFKSMKRMALLLFILLAGCSGPSTTKPAGSPAASATPVAVSTTCPDTGKGRAAVMPSLTLGSHPTVVYMDQPPANGGPVTSSLIRYDVTAASKAEIVKSVASEAEVSPAGDW